MKRFTTMVALLVLTMVLVAGCSSISKDSYDAAVREAKDSKGQLANVQADLTAAKADLTTTQAGLTKAKADLTTAQQTLTTVTTDRDSAKSQLEKAEADLTTAQANLSKSSADLTTAQQSFSTLNTSVITYQPYVDTTALWLEMYVHWESWGENTWTAWYSKMDVAISGSQELKTLWDTIRNTTGAEHIAAETSFTKLMLQRLNETKPTTN